MSRFKYYKTPVNDLVYIERNPVSDNRGFLERMFCLEELKDLVGNESIRQINHTRTTLKGTLRGIHFRHEPHDEIKIVSCVRGAVFDVGVDLRPNSSTFLKWFGVEISDSNHLALPLPKGFGHAFQTLTDDAELIYFHTGTYHPESEDGVHHLDPVLGIVWPLPVHSVSDRDQSFMPLTPERIRSLR